MKASPASVWMENLYHVTKESCMAWKDSAFELDKTYFHAVCLLPLATYLYFQTLIITNRTEASSIRPAKDRNRTLRGEKSSVTPAQNIKGWIWKRVSQCLPTHEYIYTQISVPLSFAFLKEVYYFNRYFLICF